jgi:DNA processing protein
VSKIESQKNENLAVALKLRMLATSKRVSIVHHLLKQMPADIQLERAELGQRNEEAKIDRIFEFSQKNQLGILTLFDEEYPSALKNIYDPPPVLFYKGNPNVLQRKVAVAVVGSRNGDIEGINLAIEFGRELARSNVIVVSGLAMGVDSAAHRGALNSGVNGSTIAVLGNGLPSISPPSNLKLADEIVAAGGLIISQFLPNEPGYRQNFLDRNRIISGLSCAVLVIQATERSGSLVTARHGLEQGRELMVVPGSVKNNRYAGSNKLLMDGAFLVRNPGDVLELIQVPPISDVEYNNQAGHLSSEHYLTIIRKFGSLSLADLSDKLGNPSSFHTDMLELEMLGRIILKPGNIVTAS